MIGRLLGLVTGGGLWWPVSAAALAVCGYVATTQVVLHNRQAALDAAIAAQQQLAADKATLQGQLDQVVGLNSENVKELERIRAGYDRNMADVSAELARAKKAGTKLIVVYQEAAHDPDAKALLANACPAADRYLDRLRREAGGGTPAQAGDPDRASDGRPPGRPAVVRGRAPGPAGAGDR